MSLFFSLYLGVLISQISYNDLVFAVTIKQFVKVAYCGAVSPETL